MNNVACGLKSHMQKINIPSWARFYCHYAFPILRNNLLGSFRLVSIYFNSTVKKEHIPVYACKEYNSSFDVTEWRYVMSSSSQSLIWYYKMTICIPAIVSVNPSNIYRYGISHQRPTKGQESREREREKYVSYPTTVS